MVLIGNKNKNEGRREAGFDSWMILWRASRCELLLCTLESHHF